MHFAAVMHELTQQFDIFAHSRGAILRNAVIQAVERYDAAPQRSREGQPSYLNDSVTRAR